MSQFESLPQWQVADNLRPMPHNLEIGSLVLAPLADECGDYVWLLIRYRTQYPEPGGSEGDHLYTSLAEARVEATSQFGVDDSDWKTLAPSDVRWIEKEIC
ncbi:hypothetical protein [Herbaspirillum seropedicae]|uniref:hypothetical protein n=1 Tax=Herbaspirillum seropedicae TaxID=964 RepID=UPI0012EB009A|nr:hypothetical protein [Herbaspirillum seropedicae]